MSDVLYSRQSNEFIAGEAIYACPGCENDLTIHQPDLDLWDRLLATCDECKSWFVLEAGRLDPVIPPNCLDDGPPKGVLD